MDRWRFFSILKAIDGISSAHAVMTDAAAATLKSLRVVLITLACASAIAASCHHAHDPATTMSVSDRHAIPYSELLEPPVPSAGIHIAYGSRPLQFGELRLPNKRGRFPVAVIIHGGCWLKQYDLRHAAREAAALTASGIATWTIEYRRVGDVGGGWPGTFEDVSHATDYLTQLAARYSLDLNRVVLVGHSAGGQLALWLASRSRDPKAQPNPDPAPIAVRGVVSLAGITDMRAYGARSGGCNSAVARLLGGTPAEVAERYDAVSPVVLLPIRVPVRLIHGGADAIVPVEQSRDYAARAVPGDVTATIVPDAGHFDLVAPGSAAWPIVERAVRRLLGIR